MERACTWLNVGCQRRGPETFGIHANAAGYLVIAAAFEQVVSGTAGKHHLAVADHARSVHEPATCSDHHRRGSARHHVRRRTPPCHGPAGRTARHRGPGAHAPRILPPLEPKTTTATARAAPPGSSGFLPCGIDFDEANRDS